MAPPPSPLQRPSPPALSSALLALLALVLGGCSGTSFGEALSRSFPSPSGTPGGAATPPLSAAGTAPTGGGAPSNPGSPSSGPSGTAGVQPGQAAPAAAGEASALAISGAAAPSAVVPKPGGSVAPLTGPAGKVAGVATAFPQRPAAPASANPSPYRVTIRLPQADPSAPAEVVTEALRAAGVPFEVETIERIGGGTAAPSPALPPVVPAVPQVRPAPPPR